MLYNAKKMDELKKYVDAKEDKVRVPFYCPGLWLNVY